MVLMMDHRYWFQIKLDDLQLNKNVYLEINETFLKEVELYNKPLELLHKTVNINDSNIKIPIVKTTNVLYLKVLFDKYSYIDINLLPITSLDSENNNQLLQKGGYYTLILIFVIINLLLAYFFKSKLFLWYILFFLTVNLGIALHDNTIAGLIQNTKQMNYLLAFSYWITPIAAAVFCIQFLKIENYYPKVVTTTKILLTLVTILITVFLITQNFQFVAIAQIINLLIYIGSWVIGFFLLRKVSAAKYYVLGYFVLYFTAFIYSLSINFGIHFFPLTINHLKLGVLIEISVLTYAVMRRARAVVEEHKSIKKQLINYLDDLAKINQNDSKIVIEELIISESKKFDLTVREIDVLMHLAKGCNNQEIADELFVSVNTVKYHIRNIYEKLDVRKRTEITPKLLFDK